MKKFIEDIPAWVALFIYIVVFWVAIMLLSGCTATKQATNTHVSDSVRVEIRERIIKVPDTIYYTLPAQTTERTTTDTSSFLCTDFAVSWARILENGTLYHSLENIAKPIQIYTEKEVIIHDSIYVKQAAKTETIIKTTEKKPTFLQRFQAVGFWILAAAAVVFATAFILKKIISKR